MFTLRTVAPVVLVVALLCSCGGGARTEQIEVPRRDDQPYGGGETAAVAEPSVLSLRTIALPGGPGPVRMDFIAYDPASHALWVPAGNTGRVDVIDVATDSVSTIEGFVTSEIDTPRGRRVVGPSSVVLGQGVAYVGNRGDSSVCAIDTHARTVAGCVHLESMPDAMILVPSRGELWVTTPRARSIVVLRVAGTTATPSIVETIPFDGEPECFALDAEHGVVFTNLEDQDRTLAIDASSRHVLSTWEPGCGEAGPRGLAFDGARRLVYVACTDHLATLDIDHAGAIVSTLATGGGVDDVTFVASRSLLYVGSGADALLRVVRVGEDGSLRVLATAATSTGARNAVVDEAGRAYLTDSEGARIFAVQSP